MMIQVRGLIKIFDQGKKAVNELDLSVEQGEIMGLLGPNGAGKTTTIRILSTLSGFDAGRVVVAGYDVDTDADKVRQSIGVVAQNTGIDYFLTGRENLELQGHLYRMNSNDIQARIEELASYFELKDSLDKQVMTYSGGMRRKLDIATALIHHPKVLFLDEPTLGLDIKSRKMLWRLIEKLNKEMGLTILLTTHYLEEADKLTHRVSIISSGKIRTTGTPDELKASISGERLSITFEQRTPQVNAFADALNKTDYVKDSVWEGDNKLHLYVENGAESVPRISALITQYGVKMQTLALARPTLDDVYLRYTGSSMEETKEDSGDEWWKQWAGKGGGNWGNWENAEEGGSGSSESGSGWQGNQWTSGGSDTGSDAGSSQDQSQSQGQGQEQSQGQWGGGDSSQWDKGDQSQWGKGDQSQWGKWSDK